MATARNIWIGILAALPSVYGQDDGNISACKEQSCGDCPVYASVNAGYPDCIVYPSAGNLDGYDTDGGLGYRVWWNSGQPAETCKIIVRTPASTSLPACGYYLTGWENAGCYYTLIQDSFMLQFCCGTGDCDAASPGRSVSDVRARALQGGTASLSLKFENMTAFAQAEGQTYGKRSFDEMGLEVHWEDARTPMAASQLAKYSKAKGKRQGDNCNYSEIEKYTKGGEQQRVSPTQNCNVADGCPVAISSSVTTGRSVSVNAGFNLFDIISLGTDITFTEEQSRTITSTFNQEGGSTGYVSYIPTYECTRGNLASCDGISDGIVEACSPRLLADGSNDGTYSFVYCAPGQC